MPAGQTINVDRGLTFHGGRSALYCVLPNLVDNWEIAHLYWSLLWRRKKTKGAYGRPSAKGYLRQRAVYLL